VTKVGESNPDRTISLKRLQCVVESKFKKIKLSGNTSTGRTTKESRFYSRRMVDVSLLQASIQILESTQRLIWWVPEQNGRGVKLISHHNLVTSLRTSADVLLLAP
jgi:hypothetical protein